MKRVLLLSLILCSLAYGANEIRSFQTSGSTLYSVIREVDGDVWYVAGQVFEAWGTGARTAIPLVDKAGGMFVGDFNTAISAGYYFIITHQQAGGSPADADPAIWKEYGYWNGTTWITNSAALQTIDGIADDILVDVNDIEEALAQLDVDVNDIEEYASNIMADSNELVAYNIDGLLTAIMADSNAVFTDTDSTIPGTLTTMTGYLTNIMQDSNDTITYWSAWDANFTQVVNDTNELMGDWEDGGRLDLILDAGGGGGASAADIADAVWDEAISGHTGATTFGGELQEIDPNVTLLATTLTDLKIAMDANFAAIDFDTSGIDANFLTLRTAMDANFAIVIADTNELQTDWTNGGRLDLLIDGIKKYTDLLVIVDTNVATAIDTNSCILNTEAKDANDIYKNYLIMIQDANDSSYETAIVQDYNSARVVIFDHTLGFTPAQDDKVYIFSFRFGNIWERVQRLGMTTNYFDSTGLVWPGQGVTVYNKEE